MICSIPMNEFFEVISQFPKLAERFMLVLYKNSLRHQEQISSLATESVQDRLLRVLRTLDLRIKDKQINFTHEDLAQMIGASRQTVSTLLSMLQKKGVVTKKGKNYTVRLEK